jgi:L-cysteine/cystine lyase
MNLANCNAGLDAVSHATAARHDTSAQSLETARAALAALELLGEPGWDAVQEHAVTLASRFASALQQAGRSVAPRDATTLVAWEDPDPAATRVRLAEAGVIIRDLPGTGLLRASVGAWNDETDLDRLLTALDAG